MPMSVNVQLLILLALVQAGRVRAQPGTTPPVKLEIVKFVERELSADETHSYEVHLLQGQYARVSVEQRGIDVIVNLQDPGGKDSIEFDTELRLSGTETI
jgi:hypothetical protein